MKERLRKLLAIALACFIPVFAVGCTKADLDKTVSIVEANIPTALQLALQIATIVGAFGMNPQGPTDTQKIVAGLQLLENTLIPAYQAHPSQSAFDQIAKTVNDLVATSEDQLLAAAQITNPESKQKAVIALGTLSSALLVIDGAIQAAQSTPQVKATATERKAKLSRMQSLLNTQYLDQQLKTYGYNYNQYYAHETSLGF